MSKRQISPTQLALFSRSPIIGAWWEELHQTDPNRAPKPETDSLNKLLCDSGIEHEKLLITRLIAEGKSVDLRSGALNQSGYVSTIEAMEKGYDFIHQASLQNDELRGVADLLARIDKPSKLGDWSYIPIECKLSSHPKPIYLVQACAYCEMLEPILGKRPEHFKLYLGGQKFLEEPDGFCTQDFWSWYLKIRDRYRDFLNAFDADQQPNHEPGDHGHWGTFIEEELQKERDLMLVAGMRQSQRNKLRAKGISTIDALAAIPADQLQPPQKNGEPAFSVPGMDPPVLLRLRDQAEIQIQPPQANGKPAFSVRPLDQQAKGLKMLPKPDQGDVWFDMEGYPNPLTGKKLEYLFGACYRDQERPSKPQFKSWWAHDQETEGEAFSDFVQWVEQRRQIYPDLHVYHYASYEKTALGNLASRHQIHQSLIDQWLRDELLVDLYPIVRNGLLLGAPSYSIKKVEQLYQTNSREEAVTNAADSVVLYAEWIKSGEPKDVGFGPGHSKRLWDLEKYNEKDCQSTAQLHDFLLQQPIMEEISPRLNKWEEGGDIENKDGKKVQYEKALELAARSLLNEIPKHLNDEKAIGSRGMSWEVQKLLAQLIDFQEREGKVEWWEFHNRKGMSVEEREVDTEVIHAAKFEFKKDLTTQSKGYVYSFSNDQPLKLTARAGQNSRFALAPLMEKEGRLLPNEELRKSKKKVFDLEGVLDENHPNRITLKLSTRKLNELKRLGTSAMPRYCDLILMPKQIYKRMLGNLVRQAQGWVDERKPLPAAMQHLLERRSIPALISLNAQVREQPSRTSSLLQEFLATAEGVTFSLQGPPGTGKTTVTADLIARLVQQGKRVAVSSQGHEAINSLLHGVESQLNSSSLEALVIKLSSSISESADQKFFSGTSVQALQENAIHSEPKVLGATVFSLVKETFCDAPFDLLVIDEAGQVSLSNLLYMSQCARNILLVGDQQQLSQPNRAKHPDNSGLSCLDYVMSGEPVVPPDQGVFLASSWRMPPMLTEIVSELFYRSELQPVLANADNKVFWRGLEQGLIFESVEHSNKGSLSDEEVEWIAALVEDLQGQPYQRVQQRNGELVLHKGELGPRDILITSPYNLQVNRLEERLGGKARCGTVDRFQGQQAPVAIHSLTASDGDSAPRGLTFVLDPNRLNVAISRAQCLSIVVGSPQLATGISSSIEGAKQLNRLCRIMNVNAYKS